MKVEIDMDALRPLILATVRETLAQGRDLLTVSNGQQSGDRIAWPEAEAAPMIGLSPHQLRDARLRGEIECFRGPRRKALYSREHLLAYLMRD